jgi:hypothetical protein
MDPEEYENDDTAEPEPEPSDYDPADFEEGGLYW